MADRFLPGEVFRPEGVQYAAFDYVDLLKDTARLSDVLQDIHRQLYCARIVDRFICRLNAGALNLEPQLFAARQGECWADNCCKMG